MGRVKFVLVRRVSWVLLCFCLAGVSAADSTFVPAGNIEGTWTLAASPYVVQGNLTVLAADSLSIEPGVRVYFAGAYSEYIEGGFGTSGVSFGE